MRRYNRQVTGRWDYVLGMNRHNFFSALVREARLRTDHWMVLAVLRG